MISPIRLIISKYISKLVRNTTIRFALIWTSILAVMFLYLRYILLSIKPRTKAYIILYSVPWRMAKTNVLIIILVFSSLNFRSLFR